MQGPFVVFLGGLTAGATAFVLEGFLNRAFCVHTDKLLKLLAL